MSRPGDREARARREHLGWLLRACRYWLTEEPGDAPAADPPGWRALAEFAYFHDLDPLLHHLAADSRLGIAARLPARVARQWESAYYQNFVFNTELLDLAGQLVAGCGRLGIDLRVFKGPVTLARGWLDPALRVMADVDLICHRRDLPRLAELARALGFETGEQTAAHHLALRHRALPASIELHFRLYDVVARPERLLERLWSRPDRVEVDGRRLPAPGPELAAVIDLAHLLEHDLQLGLRPLLDLSATLWRQRRALDRELLAELLAEADLEPEFRQLNALLSETLGLPALSDLSAAPVELPDGLERALVERLLSADRLHRVGALAGPHRRAGARATGRYLLRRLLPPLEQLQAMSGAETRTRALLAYPAHVLATVRRGTARWRAAGARPAGASLKAELQRRRQARRVG